MDCLDDLPRPQFSGQRQWRLNPAKKERFFPTVPLEAARGCFYGKCAFCNLNEQWGNSYRRKSDEKVIQEIRESVSSEQSYRIMMCDTDVSNRIDLFSRIQKEDLDLDLILEVSGHRDGRKEDFFRAIRDAGATQIQIGIEAFSDRLLKRMRKGVTVMKNVEMLKWCSSFGIRLFYNVLSMIPGEQQSDVADTLNNMMRLWMYEPPSRICPFVLAHDSPAARAPAQFGIRGMCLSEELRYCYPEQWMQDLAPLFTPIVGYNPITDEPYADWEEVECFAREWQEEYQSRAFAPGMTYRKVDSFLTIVINRGGRENYINLYALHKAVFEAIDASACSLHEISKSIGLPMESVKKIIEELVDLGLVFFHSNKALALPIYQNRLRYRDSIRNCFASNV